MTSCRLKKKKSTKIKISFSFTRRSELNLVNHSSWTCKSPQTIISSNYCHLLFLYFHWNFLFYSCYSCAVHIAARLWCLSLSMDHAIATYSIYFQGDICEWYSHLSPESAYSVIKSLRVDLQCNSSEVTRVIWHTCFNPYKMGQCFLLVY